MDTAQVEKGKKLKPNFIYNFISQILTLVVPLITAPYLARVLHEEGNGQISFCGSIITFFVLFANLGLSIYGQREIAKCFSREEKQKVFWEIVLLRICLTTLSLLVFFIVFFTIGYGETYNQIILLLSIQILSCAFDVQFLFQGEEDFKTIAIRSIVLRTVCLICIFVFVRTENDTWIYALCLSASMLFSNIILWPRAIKKVGFARLSSLELKKHLLPTFLIFLPTLAATIYAVFDKTMIGLLSANPDYNNGCYEQAYKLNSVTLLIVTIIAPVLMARNSTDFKNGNIDNIKSHLSKACKYVWLFSLPMIAGMAALSKNLSNWFLGDGYYEVPLLLVIMSVRYVFSGFSEIFGTQLFIPIGKEKYTTIATFIAAFLNITLNFFMIPVWGCVGASIATAISEFVVCFIMFCFSLKTGFINLKMVFSHSWKCLIGAAVMFAIVYFTQLLLPYALWSFAILVLEGAVVYYLILILFRDDFVINYSLIFLNKVKAFLNRKKM